MLLKKRFLSSPWSFARTLAEYTAADGGRGREIDDEDEYYQEVLGSGASDEEEGDAEQPEFTALRHAKRTAPLGRRHAQEIASLIAWGEGYEHRPDARLAALIEFLDATCRPGGTWTNERVVVFTEYAATLDWITRVLAQRGYRPGYELATIQGTTPTPRSASSSAPGSPRRQASTRSECSSRPTRPARASTCRTTATAWSTSTSRSTRQGLSSGSAGSTDTASARCP